MIDPIDGTKNFSRGVPIRFAHARSLGDFWQRALVAEGAVDAAIDARLAIWVRGAGGTAKGVYVARCGSSEPKDGHSIRSPSLRVGCVHRQRALPGAGSQMSCLAISSMLARGMCTMPGTAIFCSPTQ